MLTLGHRKSEIKAVCRNEYGSSARTVARCLSEVRNILINELDETREDLLTRSLSLYRSILTDKDADFTLPHASDAERYRVHQIRPLCQIAGEGRGNV